MIVVATLSVGTKHVEALKALVRGLGAHIALEAEPTFEVEDEKEVIREQGLCGAGPEVGAGLREQEAIEDVGADVAGLGLAADGLAQLAGSAGEDAAALALGGNLDGGEAGTVSDEKGGPVVKQIADSGVREGTGDDNSIVPQGD